MADASMATFDTLEVGDLEVTAYLEAVAGGAAALLQPLPIVGIVCNVFLTFVRVVETATSNKEDLIALKELCDIVIRGVVKQRWEQKKGADDDLVKGVDDGWEKLKTHINSASEIATRCSGHPPRQFLFSRRTAKDIAAVGNNVLGLCTANTVLLSASTHADLDRMSQIWSRFDSIEESGLMDSPETANQELPKAPRVTVPGSPRIRDWYVERAAVLSKACDGLGVGSSFRAFQEPRMVGLAGPGGAGKSTVASMVVARQDVRHSFRNGVLWLSVGKGAKDRLPALMFDLARMVYETMMDKACRPPRKAEVLTNTEDGAAYIREVVDERSRRFLVVADDVWDVEVLEELKKAGAWVLYTTRQGIRMPDAPLVRLDEVLREEAEMVLRRAAELDDDAKLPPAAYEVMDKCGFVVLDLVLVGRRDELRGRSDERAWRKVLGRILEAQEEGGQRRAWRAAALHAGLEVLAADHPLNKELYLALALLPTGLAFPSKVAGVLLYGDDCSVDALKAASKVLEVLERLSILALEEGGYYRVHEDHVDFVRDCLKTNQETRDAALPRWRKYISSVETLNTYTSDWLVKMWNVLAQVEERGVAPSPYEATLHALGPSSPKFPMAVRKVAEFHFERRDWLEAYHKYYSLLVLEEEHAADGHGLPEAKILHKLGMCASEMPGFEEKTVKLLRQALKIQEKTLGGDHPNVAQTLHSLGVCIRVVGETGEAEELLRQALAISKEKLSGDPLGLARIQYSLGVCLYNTWRLQEAREMLEPALAIRVEMLGHDHPEVANALYYLGLCDHKEGRTEEGEEKLNEALGIFEQKLGKDHLDVADAFFSLGMCDLEAGGLVAEAEKRYRRSLAIRQHLKVESALHALGVCASIAGRMEETRGLLGKNPGVAVCGGANKFEKDTPQDNRIGSKVLKVSGFMDARTSFIPSKAESEGVNHGDVQVEARTEADVRHLLAELIFGATVSSESVQCKGVFLSEWTVDFEYATSLGLTIKLLGTATLSPDNDKLSVAMSPVVVPPTHLTVSPEGPGGVDSQTASTDLEPVGVDTTHDWLARHFSTGTFWREYEWSLFREILELVDPSHSTGTKHRSNTQGAWTPLQVGEAFAAQKPAYRPHPAGADGKACSPGGAHPWGEPAKRPHPAGAGKTHSTDWPGPPEQSAKLKNPNGAWSTHRAEAALAEPQPAYRAPLVMDYMALNLKAKEVGTNGKSARENEGKFAEAEPLYERATEIWEKALGRDHPTVATVLNNRAWLLQDEAKYVEADHLYERSQAIREKVLGPEHPDAAQSPITQARLLMAQGTFADAQRLYARAIEIGGPLDLDHPSDLATRPNNLAELIMLGQCDEAGPVYERPAGTCEEEQDPLVCPRQTMGLFILPKRAATTAPDIFVAMITCWSWVWILSVNTYTWWSRRVQLLALQYLTALRTSGSVYDKRTASHLLRGKSGAWPNPMLGLFAAASFVPGVAATATFGERLELTVSALLEWFCQAHWLVHVLVVTLAGSCFYRSVIFSIGEFKAGNAEFSAAGRRLLQAKQAAIARRQGRSRTRR